MAEKTAAKAAPPIPDEDKNADDIEQEVPSTNSDTEDVKPIICPNCKFVIPPAGKEGSVAKKRVQPPWWSNEVEDAIEKKRKALKVSNRTGRASDLLNYKKANAFARYTVRNAKAKYQESLQDSEPNKEQNDSEDQSDKTGSVSADGGEGENKNMGENVNNLEGVDEGVIVKVEPPDKDNNIVNEPNDYESEKEKHDSDKESASSSVKE